MSLLVGANGGGGPTYNCSALFASDLMLMASPFLNWDGDKTPPPIRADGYPAFIDGTTGNGRTILALNAPLDAGTYRLTATGSGEIQVSAYNWLYPAAQNKYWEVIPINGPTTYDLVAVLPKGAEQITLQITLSQPGDPVRDVHVWLPGGSSSSPFNPAFLQDIAPFRRLRFMDWVNTNGSTLAHWSDLDTRPFGVLAKGIVPYAMCARLCNANRSRMWMNIPYHATPDFIAEQAAEIDAVLDPDLGIDIEDSNEMWNPGFQQAQDSITETLATGSDISGIWHYHGQKAAIAVNLFKAALSPSRDCRRVICAQATYSGAADLTLAAAAENGGFDAVGTAPYFQQGTPSDRLAVLAAQYNAGDQAAKDAAVDEVIADLGIAIAGALATAAEWKTRAGSKPLVLYECGQHLVDPFDATPEALFSAVNRAAAIGDSCTAYLSGLRDAGVAEANWFTSHGLFGRFGAWGLKETTGPPGTAKYDAVANFISPTRRTRLILARRVG